ncbi:MAG: recombinase family protein [Oscillibacter sp.]|nr:recombinase family protein [Oscillibacter sp.]
MIKVASYCRVSTDRDDQANSFESQQRYFKEYIARQPDWELYEVYADEGITGTSTKKRAAFNRMIADAHSRKFQLILTKEVSRFSRNILDTITYTRELKALGVGVLFMNDGISTMEPDAELRLSIMGSIAQEESRKTSTRVKWGQTRRMEQGIVFGRSLLGYDVKDGCLTINRSGAEIVRLIFYKYGVEKKGTTVIARELREAGYRTHSGNVNWSNTHIVKILKNEKYVGDLVQKKTITPDYLSHAKKYNHGEEELVAIRSHHEPIIDRELWDTVQRELKKRNRNGELGAGHSNRYVFSGKIKCGECGASFVSRKKTRKDGSLYKRWSCYTATSEGRKRIDIQGNEVGCDVGKLLREELALEILQQSLTALRMDRDQIIQNVTALAVEAIQMCEEGSIDRVDVLEYEISQLKQKKADVLDAFFSKQITKEEMQLINRRYDRELEALQKRLETAAAKECVAYETDQLRKDISQKVTEIVNGKTDSEVLYKNVLNRMVVHKDRTVEVFLNLLPQTWIFLLEDLREPQNEPSVPISVSSPFSSA